MSHKFVTEFPSHSQKLELNIDGQLLNHDRSADSFYGVIYPLALELDIHSSGRHLCKM